MGVSLENIWDIGHLLRCIQLFEELLDSLPYSTIKFTGMITFWQTLAFVPIYIHYFVCVCAGVLVLTTITCIQNKVPSKTTQY